MRFLPEDSARLIVAAESVGFAMKNREMGMVSPLRPAVDQFTADVALRAAGTNTSYLSSSRSRKGAGRETGVVGSEVLSPGPKSVAGAPCTPEKTVLMPAPAQRPI